VRKLTHDYGSPPHAWGHCLAALRPLVAHRFTPTRVGTLSSPWRWPPSCSVHPHTRGDIAPRHFGIPSTIRFTPTRVGTLARRISSRARSSVHPHTRGDIGIQMFLSSNWIGSPPHAWGHLQYRFPLLQLVGSPPHAWGHYRDAGATGRDSRFTPTRVGTLFDDAVSLNNGIGSPPHAWGHSYPSECDLSYHRFTPTRVGTLGSMPR